MSKLKCRLTRMAIGMTVGMLLFRTFGTVPAGADPMNDDRFKDDFYHGKKQYSDIWTAASDDSKYPNHRIPGIVVTKKDTVIIYCEARTGDTKWSLKNNGDWCLMDIYIQRSTDGGETFGDPIYIAKGTQETATVNNPVMIVGEDNTLHMLYCKNYSIRGGGLWYRKSTDDGLTWTPEREVSEYAASVPHDAFAFGPTHGICTTDGKLMAPVWLVPLETGRDGVDTSHGPSKAYVFYSTDNGETWALSEVASANAGETDIVELSDGRILLNSRAIPRRVTTSPNGIDRWTATYADDQLPDPGCCAGMVTVDLPGLPYAHLFTNCASLTDRDHLTLRVSFDDCVTWEKSVTISELSGGYSDVAVDSQGKIYVLYELSFGKRVRLARLSFYDEFCADKNGLREKTVFDFSDAADRELVKSAANLSAQVSDGVLSLTSTDTRRNIAVLDFTAQTRLLNLSDFERVELRMQVNAAGGEPFSLGFGVTSGRVREYSGERMLYTTVPNDGAMHTVLFDVSDVRGMLRSLRLELYSETLKSEIGDCVKLDSIRFLRAGEKAEGETDAPAADPATPGTNAADPKTGGCGSGLSVLPAMVCLAATGFCLCKRRKKRN